MCSTIQLKSCSVTSDTNHGMLFPWKWISVANSEENKKSANTKSVISSKPELSRTMSTLTTGVSTVFFNLLSNAQRDSVSFIKMNGFRSCKQFIILAFWELLSPPERDRSHLFPQREIWNEKKKKSLLFYITNNSTVQKGTQKYSYFYKILKMSTKSIVSLTQNVLHDTVFSKVRLTVWWICKNCKLH